MKLTVTKIWWTMGLTTFFLGAIFGLAAGHMAFAASVQQDAYPITGHWQSYPDYLQRKLTVEGFTNPVCSSDVIWLGGNYYRIPQGVSEFKCYERGEA